MDLMIETAIMVGKILAGCAALVGSLTVLAKSPVGKGVHWLYVRLFGEPVGLFLRRQVGQVVDEKLLARNGGTTVPDAIERIERIDTRLSLNHAANEKRLDAIESRLGISH